MHDKNYNFPFIREDDETTYYSPSAWQLVYSSQKPKRKEYCYIAQEMELNSEFKATMKLLAPL